MVIAAPIASSVRSSASTVPKNPISASRKTDASPNPSRRSPGAKDISSRYLSSSSSSLAASSSILSNTAASSSFRRFPSPLPNRRPSTPAAFPPRSALRRSQSVDRSRPITPDVSNAARALYTTTRSLSVSFQGESFVYQTSKAKAISPAPSRKPAMERRRVSTVEKPLDYRHCWPAARSSQSILLSKSMDCSSDKDPVLSTVRLLRQSMLFDDGAEVSVSSDTDSLSSGSNSGCSGGGGMPARFRQEKNSRLRSTLHA